MAQVITPPDVAAPFSRYAHGILTKSGCRWLHVSGQVGILPDGTMAMSGEAQLEQAFSNVFAVLRAAGMDKQHLVKLTVLLTRADEVGSYRTVRDRLLDGLHCGLHTDGGGRSRQSRLPGRDRGGRRGPWLIAR